MLKLIPFLWEGFRPLFIFIGGITTLFSGAFGTLVVLHYQEHTNPAFVIATLVVYVYVAAMVVVVTVNRA